ncbi:phospholipidtransporting ATPase [Perkinsela sp. CCAP 1560/4]|nr:phospholipidtransporting ATPase [Perkinsela sp. CCAP 1560/4]|eukprot:KNH05622.1 phospholipidtransporting ATPase [Perkinsela sp. CCAP 1560/4]
MVIASVNHSGLHENIAQEKECHPVEQKPLLVKPRNSRQCTKAIPLLCRSKSADSSFYTRKRKQTPYDPLSQKYSISARMSKSHIIPDMDILSGFSHRELAGYAEKISHYIHKVLNVDVTPLDDKTLTDYVFKQCVNGCQDAIDKGTFSVDYPKNCLNRIIRSKTGSNASECHGLALVSGKNVLAWIYTDANGGIANLRGTLAAIKRSTHRKPENVTPFMRTLLDIHSFKNFAHIKLLVTHCNYRGKGYAKILLFYALVYWADRFRTQAFLNMALEKSVDKVTGKGIASPSVASQRLYEYFGFHDAYPKFNQEGEMKYSIVEGHQGRLMLNVDVMETIRSIAEDYGFSQ